MPEAPEEQQIMALVLAQVQVNFGSGYINEFMIYKRLSLLTSALTLLLNVLRLSCM